MKRLSSGSRIVLKSHFACEISRVNIYQDRQEERERERARGNLSFYRLEDMACACFNTKHPTIDSHLSGLVPAGEREKRDSVNTNPNTEECGAFGVRLLLKTTIN